MVNMMVANIDGKPMQPRLMDTECSTRVSGRVAEQNGN
jgi:hypothetical protein